MRDDRRWILGTLAVLAGAGCMGESEATEEVPPTGMAPPAEIKQGLTRDPILTSVTFDLVSASNTAGATAANTPLVKLGPIPAGTQITVDTCNAQRVGDTLIHIVRLNGSSIVRLGSDFTDDDGCGFAGGSTKTVTIPTTADYGVLAGCFSSNSCSSAVHVTSPTRIEHRWAPAIYQDTWPDLPSWTRAHDYLSLFNYDGDYNGSNNDVNFPGRRLDPWVYVSHVESGTHWFLGYYFYHPMDRSHSGPNDLEGVIFSIRKEGVFGRLETWLSKAHENFVPAEDLSLVTPCLSGFKNPISWHHGVVNSQPAVYIEPRGHGVYSCLQKDCGQNDGLVYLFENWNIEAPGFAPEANCGLGNQNMSTTPTCGYGLIAMEESNGRAPGDGSVNQGIYYLRDQIGPGKVFESPGVFQGGEANPPWAWAANILNDPAVMFRDLLGTTQYGGTFCGPPTMSYSTTYVFNPYR